MPYHHAVLDLAKSLDLEFEGFCHAITVRWLEACFLDEEGIFWQRMGKILLDNDKLIALIKEKKNKEGFFTNPDIPYDILAFIDNLRLYMAENQVFSPLDWPTSLAGHDLNSASKIAGSDKIQELGGLSIIESIPLILNEAEIENALLELGQHLENITPPFKGPIGFILNGPHHVMGMSYEIGVGWRFMDINQYSVETGTKVDAKIAAKKIMKGLKEDPSNSFLAFSVSLVPNPHHLNNEALDHQFKQWKKKHPITEEMALRQESVNLAYIATELNDVTAIKILGEFRNPKINFDIQSYGKKQTPLTIAVYYGFIPAIKELAQQKVDFNLPGPYGATAALIATQRGRLNVVQELKSNGVDFNHPCTIPIILLEKIAKANDLTAKMKKFIDLQLTKNKNAKNISITPFTMAVLMNHKEIVTFLTSDLHQKKLRIPSSYSSLIENNPSPLSKIKIKVNFNLPGPYGATAALIATQRGQLNVVQELKSNGVDFNHPCTIPIILLEKIAKANDLTAKMKKFIDLQLTKNKNAKNISITPFTMAVLMNHKEIVTFLTADLHQKKLRIPSSYSSLIENNPSPLSKIKIMLLNYTDGNSAINRFFHGHWNRHHIKEVEEIIKQIDQGDITSPQEALEMLHYIPLINREGSLAHAIQFIRDEICSSQPASDLLGQPGN